MIIEHDTASAYAFRADNYLVDYCRRTGADREAVFVECVLDASTNLQTFYIRDIADLGNRTRGEAGQPHHATTINPSMDDALAGPQIVPHVTAEPVAAEVDAD